MSLIIFHSVIYICFPLQMFTGEFDHAINLSRPKIIFASSAVAKRAIKISEKNAFVQNVIHIDTEAGQSDKKFTSKLTTSYTKLIGNVRVCFQ